LFIFLDRRDITEGEKYLDELMTSLLEVNDEDETNENPGMMPVELPVVRLTGTEADDTIIPRKAKAFQHANRIQVPTQPNNGYRSAVSDEEPRSELEELTEDEPLPPEQAINEAREDRGEDEVDEKEKETEQQQATPPPPKTAKQNEEPTSGSGAQPIDLTSDAQIQTTRRTNKKAHVPSALPELSRKTRSDTKQQSRTKETTAKPAKKKKKKKANKNTKKKKKDTFVRINRGKKKKPSKKITKWEQDLQDQNDADYTPPTTTTTTNTPRPRTRSRDTVIPLILTPPPENTNPRGSEDEWDPIEFETPASTNNEELEDQNEVF